MMVTDIPPDVGVLASRYGIPSFVLVALWWIAPKAWAAVKARMSIAQQTNDLAQAGLGGVTDVIATLRGQISDLTQQFRDVEQKLKDMSVTLDDAVRAKLLAEQEAAKAKSDLYAMQLWIERLQVQIRSLGAVPVEKAP